MNKSASQVLSHIEALASERCSGNDPAHDTSHVRRVVVNAESILTGEPDANRFVTLAAAWLHDIVQLPKGTGAPGESARRSAAMASQWLTNAGIPPETIDAVAHAVETHSFSGGQTPQTIEAAIVQDADRLDAIGAIGIARLWVTAAVMGSALHHPDDPAGLHRELDDRAYGLDHIPAKLEKLPGLMNTSTGKRLASERAEYVSLFRERFLSELQGQR